MLTLFHRVMRGGGAVYELIEELDLSLTHMKLLTTLSDEGGDRYVKQVAETLGLSLPGASRAVDALLRRGLLEREEDERDRRMKLIRLTDAGRDVVRRIEDARLAGLANFTASLTGDERALLSAALDPILARRAGAPTERSPA